MIKLLCTCPPCGYFLLSEDGRVLVFDLPSLQLLSTGQVSWTSAIGESMLSPDGGRLVFRSEPDLLRVFHLPSLEQRREIKVCGTATRCTVSRSTQRKALWKF